jgi:hypothetical protein
MSQSKQEWAFDQMLRVIWGQLRNEENKNAFLFSRHLASNCWLYLDIVDVLGDETKSLEYGIPRSRFREWMNNSRLTRKESRLGWDACYLINDKKQSFFDMPSSVSYQPSESVEFEWHVNDVRCRVRDAPSRLLVNKSRRVVSAHWFKSHSNRKRDQDPDTKPIIYQRLDMDWERLWYHFPTNSYMVGYESVTSGYGNWEDDSGHPTSATLIPEARRKALESEYAAIPTYVPPECITDTDYFSKANSLVMVYLEDLEWDDVLDQIKEMNALLDAASLKSPK